MRKRIGIIGGGVAGLFAACQLKRLDVDGIADVTLIEKNPLPGKKLLLTGHGRCNITNRKDASELKKGYHEASNFIYPALREYGPEDTMEFVSDTLGLKLKEEENNRIFPVCDNAVRVRDSIVDYISDRTKILSETKVTKIAKRTTFDAGPDKAGLGAAFNAEPDNAGLDANLDAGSQEGNLEAVFEVETDKGELEFDMIILSCGGSSFTRTGSAGDSYRLAKGMGHKVNPVKGALCPVNADEASIGLCRTLAGVSLSAKVTLFAEGKKTASTEGELLFADFGLTGPAVMEISREIPINVRETSALLELDLVPEMSDEEFDRELQNLIREHPDTKITTLLSRFIPASVAAEAARQAGAADLYAQGFAKAARKDILRLMKHLRIGIGKAPEIERAYVTRGGVALEEVDRKSMGSKLVDGLYILGEALDIDGISGGYNLQACMSEAYLASKSILSRISASGSESGSV